MLKLLVHKCLAGRGFVAITAVQLQSIPDRAFCTLLGIYRYSSGSSVSLGFIPPHGRFAQSPVALK